MKCIILLTLLLVVSATAIFIVVVFPLHAKNNTSEWHEYNVCSNGRSNVATIVDESKWRKKIAHLHSKRMNNTTLNANNKSCKNYNYFCQDLNYRKLKRNRTDLVSCAVSCQVKNGIHILTSDTEMLIKMVVTH